MPPPRSVEHSRAVLCTAMGLSWPEDRSGRRLLAEASIVLGDAIDRYERLEKGLTGWENCYPELGGVTDEPEQAALSRASEDAAEEAVLLTEAAGLAGCW